MKEALKKTWIVIVLALIAGSVGTGYLVHSHSQTSLGECKNSLVAAQSQVSQFCAGTKLMHARVTSVSCNMTEEICICGDPSKLLDGGM